MSMAWDREQEHGRWEMVPAKPPALVATKPAEAPLKLDEWISKHLDSISKHLDGGRLLKTARSTFKLRKCLQMSQAAFARFIEPFVGHLYTAGTVSAWEMWERRRVLPRGYWSKHYMRRKTERALQDMIGRIVAWASRGVWSALVTGKRTWRVTLKRV